MAKITRKIFAEVFEQVSGGDDSANSFEVAEVMGVSDWVLENVLDRHVEWGFDLVPYADGTIMVERRGSRFDVFQANTDKELEDMYESMKVVIDNTSKQGISLGELPNVIEGIAAEMSRRGLKL